MSCQDWPSGVAPGEAQEGGFSGVGEGDAVRQALHAIASDLLHVASGGECAPETLAAGAEILLKIADARRAA